jgi:hypothetical protein
MCTTPIRQQQTSLAEAFEDSKPHWFLATLLCSSILEPPGSTPLESREIFFKIFSISTWYWDAFVLVIVFNCRSISRERSHPHIGVVHPILEKRKKLGVSEHMQIDTYNFIEV